MDDKRTHIISLLDQFTSGALTREEFLAALITDHHSYSEVGDFARIDLQRRERTGVPEVILATGKTPDQIVAIARRMIESGNETVIATRASAEQYESIAVHIVTAKYHPHSRVIVFQPEAKKELLGNIGIVTGGTSDIPVAEESEILCHALGSRTTRIADIGVACLDRTLDAIPTLTSMNVVICVAGMEAALPSVLSGLLSVPIIAVPSSVGYGVNTGGFNALLSVLGSCTPGVLAVNIDNGVAAAAAAHRINMLAVKGGRNERA